MGFAFQHFPHQWTFPDARDLSVCPLRSKQEQVSPFLLYLPLPGPLLCFTWHSSNRTSIMLLTDFSNVKRKWSLKKIRNSNLMYAVNYRACYIFR